MAAGPSPFAGDFGRSSISREDEVIQSILLCVYGPMCDGRGTISRFLLEHSRQSGLWQLPKDRPAPLHNDLLPRRDSG